MSYLKHYNHNHDALGRFAGRSGVSAAKKALKKERIIVNRDFDNVQKNGGHNYIENGPIKNRKKVKEKVRDEIRNNKELKKLEKEEKNIWKEFDKADTQMQELRTKGKISKETYKKLDAINERAYENVQTQAKIRKQIASKYVYEHADATIKDLGLNNNEKVREYIVSRSDEYYYAGDWSYSKKRDKNMWKSK